MIELFGNTVIKVKGLNIFFKNSQYQKFLLTYLKFDFVGRANEEYSLADSR